MKQTIIVNYTYYISVYNQPVIILSSIRNCGIRLNVQDILCEDFKLVDYFFYKIEI